MARYFKTEYCEAFMWDGSIESADEIAKLLGVWWKVSIGLDGSLKPWMTVEYGASSHVVEAGEFLVIRGTAGEDDLEIDALTQKEFEKEWRRVFATAVGGAGNSASVSVSIGGAGGSVHYPDC